MKKKTKDTLSILAIIGITLAVCVSISALIAIAEEPKMPKLVMLEDWLGYTPIECEPCLPPETRVYYYRGEFIAGTENPYATKQKLTEAFWSLEGVAYFMSSNYVVTISLGKLYTWAEVGPKVIRVFRKFKKAYEKGVSIEEDLPNGKEDPIAPKRGDEGTF